MNIVNSFLLLFKSLFILFKYLWICYCKNILKIDHNFISKKRIYFSDYFAAKMSLHIRLSFHHCVLQNVEKLKYHKPLRHNSSIFWRDIPVWMGGRRVFVLGIPFIPLSICISYFLLQFGGDFPAHVQESLHRSHLTYHRIYNIVSKYISIIVSLLICAHMYIYAFSQEL